jgi:translation elongation factor EF-G
MKGACFEGVKTALLRPLPDGLRIAFIQVTVVDGAWHDTDTDEMAITIAASMAVQNAISRAHLIPA